MLDKMSSLWRCLYVVLLLIAVSPLLRAQTAATGALSGTVTDQSSSRRSQCDSHGDEYTTRARRGPQPDGDGSYRFGCCRRDYRVRFEALDSIGGSPFGHRRRDRDSCLDHGLEVGIQSQEVTVRGKWKTAIQTSEATVGTVMTGKTIVELPLTTRNYTNLLGLAAGANVGVYDAANSEKARRILPSTAAQPTKTTSKWTGPRSVWRAMELPSILPAIRALGLQIRTRFRNSRFRPRCSMPATGAIRAPT